MDVSASPQKLIRFSNAVLILSRILVIVPSSASLNLSKKPLIFSLASSKYGDNLSIIKDANSDKFSLICCTAGRFQSRLKNSLIVPITLDNVVPSQSTADVNTEFSFSQRLNLVITSPIAEDTLKNTSNSTSRIGPRIFNPEVIKNLIALLKISITEKTPEIAFSNLSALSSVNSKCPTNSEKAFE